MKKTTNLVALVLLSLVLITTSCKKDKEEFEVIKSRRLAVSDSISSSLDFLFIIDLLILSDFGDSDYFKVVDM